MKYIYCIFICFLFTVPVLCQVQEDNVVVAKNNADKIRDIKGVKVLVEKFTQEFKDVGFDDLKINSFVSEKLRNNSCLDPNSDSYLYVNINPIRIDENTFATSVHISLNRPVYFPAEDKTFISMATVWQTGSIIIFPMDSVDYINDILDKLMDKFILDWYKSQIPYKNDGTTDELKENKSKEAPKKEGQVDEKSLRQKGQAVA